MKLYIAPIICREEEAVFLGISEGEEKVCRGEVTNRVVTMSHCNVKYTSCLQPDVFNPAQFLTRVQTAARLVAREMYSSIWSTCVLSSAAVVPVRP